MKIVIIASCDAWDDSSFDRRVNNSRYCLRGVKLNAKWVGYQVIKSTAMRNKTCSGFMWFLNIKYIKSIPRM